MRKYAATLFAILIVSLLLSLVEIGLAQSDPHGDYSNVTGKCYTCHRTHAGPGNDLLNHSVLSNEFCFTCHNGTGAEAAPVVSTHANVDFAGGAEEPFRLVCVQCHDPHGSRHNLDGIKEYIEVRDGVSPVTSGAVTFTGAVGPNSYDDGASDPASRVCVTCHNHPDNPGYPMVNHIGGAGHLEGGHDYSGQDCIACHPHSADDEQGTQDGFMPAGGCGDCHATVQDQADVGPAGGRRPAAGEFSASSHHAEAATDGDCQVCHAETDTHADGYLQLWDVDSGAIYAETTPGDFRPENLTASAGQALAPFCLNCHDADGAGGTLSPFSDGRTVPFVDGAAWLALTDHIDGTTTTDHGCLGVGDGASSGCHATGHGSDRANLLNPAWVRLDPDVGGMGWFQFPAPPTSPPQHVIYLPLIAK